MSTTIGSFIGGGIAACGAVTVTHSFETVKTRLQLQGELAHKGDAPRLYKGVLHGVGVVLKNDGPRGLMRGIGAAYCYQVLLNGCRLGFYEPVRSTTALVTLGDASRQNPVINMVSGATTGIMGAILGSPLFLVKTRLQSYSEHVGVGQQHRYRGALDGLRTIYRTEGPGGWYRGVGAAMIRTGFGSSVQLPTYYLAKRELEKLGVKDGPTMHLGCSAVSGFVVCCFMHPPDTVMSRLYNQRGNLYSGVVDCVTKTVKTEGPMALYKGFMAHLARILPHTILTLTFAEQTNKWMRSVERKLHIVDAPRH